MSQPTATREVGLDHYAQAQAFTEAAALVAGRMWDEVNPNRVIDSWAEQVQELTAVVSGAQLGTARQADSYIADALEVQDLSTDAVAPVDPAGFSGTASDGRPLLSLLTSPAFITVATIADGVDILRAMQFGRASLDTIVRTQVADAGRLADQVSMTSHPSVDGYIRQTDGNPCARCLVLAGRVYRWNRGFRRHPRCGCTHVPAGSGVRPLDPRAIYDRMTAAQRSRAGFTLADQRALADGGDIFQIVNARHRPNSLLTVAGERPRGLRRAQRTMEGVGPQSRAALFRVDATTGRFVPRLAVDRPRWTVDEIYRVAGDDRDLAIDLLGEFGYLRAATREPTLRDLRQAAKALGLRNYSDQSARQIVERLQNLDAFPPPSRLARMLAQGVGGGAPGAVVPGARGLSRLTVGELRALAKERGVVGYSRMRKAELLEALGTPAPVKVAKKAAAPAKAAKAAPRKAAAPDLTGARGLSTDPAVREVQIENRIREAYARAPKRGGDTVNLVDLRDALGESVNRHELDAALIRMGRRDASLLPNENRKGLTRADRDAAVQIGPVDYHFFVLNDATLRPLPATPRKAAKAAPAKKAAKATAPPAPSRMTVAALRTELERAGVTVPARLPKAKLADEVTALRGGASADEIGARLNPPTGARPVPIRSLFDADDATIEAALRDVYEGQFGPYTTRVSVGVRRAGTRVDSRGRTRPVDPSISVGGEIFDSTGRKIGYFGRTISEGNVHYADGVVRREIWAEHATVQLEPRFQGKGFGAAFNQRAIEWYRASGVHGISLSDHNGYVWASQGFGFAQGKVPEHTVTALRSLIDDLRAGRTKDQFGVAIPRALREAKDLDAQLAIAEDVLRRATTLQPGTPGYPTARELSQIGRTTQHGKTSTWLGKFFMFNNGSTSELILNPGQGVVIS